MSRALVLAITLAATCAVAAPALLPEPIQQAVEAARAAAASGAPDSAVALMEPALRAARAVNDAATEAQLLIEIGLTLKRSGREVQAEPRLVEAVKAAEAARDSTILCAALYRLAQTIDAQGRPPRAIPVYERLLVVADSARERAYSGRGQLMLARRSLQAGDYKDARARLDAAELIFRAVGEEGDAIEARFFRGILLRQTGDFDGARTAWEDCLEYARAHRDAEKVGLCLNNLALLDMSLGDPGRAADRWGKRMRSCAAKVDCARRSSPRRMRPSRSATWAASRTPRRSWSSSWTLPGRAATRTTRRTRSWTSAASRRVAAERRRPFDVTTRR